MLMTALNLSGQATFEQNQQMLEVRRDARLDHVHRVVRVNFGDCLAGLAVEDEDLDMRVLLEGANDVVWSAHLCASSREHLSGQFTSCSS